MIIKIQRTKRSDMWNLKFQALLNFVEGGGRVIELVTLAICKRLFDDVCDAVLTQYTGERQENRKIESVETLQAKVSM